MVLARRDPWYSQIVSPTLAVLVSAALALGPAPTRLPDRFSELEAHVQELAGQKRYRELAEAGAAAFKRRDLEPYQRRAMAFFAIRGLHGVFEATGEVSTLCDAGRLMRRVRAEVGFGDDAGTATRLRAATEKLLARAGAKDPCAKAKPAKPPRPALAAAEPATPEPAPADPSQAAEAPALAQAEAHDEDVPRDTSALSHVPKDTSVKPAADPGPSPLPLRPVGRPERDALQSDRLLHGGVAAVALAIVGTVGLGVSLHYRGRTADTLAALRATALMRGASTPEEYTQAYDLNARYGRLTAVAGVGGALAVVGVVGSLTLFTLRAQRAKTSAGPWLGPAWAGLSIRGRF